jgi:hypothetical protein
MAETFIIEAHVGHRVAGWPLGRLDVGPEELSVRSWPYARFRKRTVAKEAVKAVAVRNSRPVPSLKVEDSDGIFSDVVIVMPFGAARIISELKISGYTVV